MAATYIRPYKTAKGSTSLDTMKDRFDYGLDPKKCAVVSSYLCDPATAHAEFMLVKSQYQAETGRDAGHGHLFFQIRQGFPPGEITPEEANRLGYETSMRWTKGKYQFFVCTHTDKGCIHNHIYYNSTAYDRSRKFHNFLGSTFAVRRLSDRVCLEHNLSVIADPKQHSKTQFKHYGQWQGPDKLPPFKQRLKAAIDAVLSEKPKNLDAFFAAMDAAGFAHKWGRGGVLSFKVEEQTNYTRLRSSTLGEGYGQDDIIAIIEGRSALPSGRARIVSDSTGGKVNLIIDVQDKIRQGKGRGPSASPAYQRWASVYNLKQMAAALQYLQEHDLLEYAELEKHAARAVDRTHDLAGKIQTTEAAIKRNAGLRSAVVDYARTRPIFEEYKARKYSRAYLAEHEDDIAAYRAAQASMKELLNGERLPKMDALRAEAGRLAADKKSLYADYRAAQKNMREAVAVKGNIDHLLGVADKDKNREQEL